ncbi:MAG TPA: PEP-CTERM sorting domain-containing protein [Tepidisphaeraceae bacterium]|jgi:hypothetical protein|nr:PEP-CTERM sorting domain-containing protein [Tepidisphaeraceae bacterium]
MLQNLKALSAIVVAAVGLTIPGTEASAAVIASYDFNATPSPRAASRDTEPNSVAGSFVTAGGGTISSGSNSAIQTYASITSQDANAAITNNDYFGFTVTPTVDYRMDLTNLTFESLTRFNSGTGTDVGFFVRSSVDAFASDIASFSQSAGIANASVQRDVQLTAAAFQGLTTATEFRIYFYETVSSTESSDAFRVDNVVLNGTVAAVPEPASLGIAMIGGLALLARRR